MEFDIIAGFPSVAGPEAASRNDPSKRYRWLLQARADVTRGHEAMLSAVQAAGRTLAAEEARQSDAALAFLSGTARELTQLQLDREEQRETAARMPAGSLGTARGEVASSRSPRYRDMFPQAAYDRAGFDSFDDFARAMHSNLADPRLSIQAAAFTEAGAAGGGYLVPGEYAARMLDASLEDEIVRPRAAIFPMQSDSLHVAGFSHGDGSDGSFFGLVGGWTAEAANIGTSTPNVKALLLEAKKLAALIQLSNEIVADAQGLGQMLETALRGGLSNFLDSGFISGTGAGEPLGFLNAPACIEVAKETNQAGGTIVYENLSKIYSRMHPPSRGRAVWVANSDTLPELLTVGIPVTVGNNAVPLVRESDAGVFTIFGRPLILTEKVPSIGSRGDVSFLDLSQYAVGMRAEFVLERSIHLGFQDDTSWWRAKLRADGGPLWRDVYTPLNGATLSPFVTLAARA